MTQQEYSSSAHITNGANLLPHTILEIDRGL